MHESAVELLAYAAVCCTGTWKAGITRVWYSMLSSLEDFPNYADGINIATGNAKKLQRFVLDTEPMNVITWASYEQRG